MRSSLRSRVGGLGLTLAVTAAAVVGGCASKPAEPEDIGVVRLELTSIPADVNCLRLTATGARTVVQQFDVTPGTDASLLVTGLPTGLVTITADAFAATCATAGDRSTANWVSEPQTLEVSSNDIADLSLVMHRNGKVRIGVDFKPDVAPTCTDGIQNGNETGVDCGGGTCPKCGAGQSCRIDSDCPPDHACAGFTCRPIPASSCTDGIQNGNETGVDCGGGTCPKCGAGESCRTDMDCPPDHACAGFTCRPIPASSCTDGIQNGNETGVDCGGGTCPKCGAGESCRTDMDCPAGQRCAGFTCRPELSCTLPAGGVGWWRAEGNYLDSIGTHDGATFGNVPFVPGAVGSAFSFDGVTLAYVDAVPAPDLDVSSGFTIDAWVNISGESGRIVDKIHAFGNDGYLLDLVGGRLRIISGGLGLVTPNPLPTNTFIHVAGVADAVRVALFVNGVLVVEMPSNGYAVPVNDLPLRIGADSGGGSLFPGAIDEPRLFNRGLTDAEIRGLFLTANSCQ